VSCGFFDHIDEVNFRLYKLFKSCGIDAEVISKPLLHCKLIVIDGKYTFCGSHNLSWLSLNNENEASFLIKSGKIASVFVKKIFKD